MPLSHIEDWIFDLDNTLYPAECDLFAEIDVRMGAFIQDFLKVDAVEARRVQKSFFKEYGTTLNGLMLVHNLNPKLFLDYVHDIDHSAVEENALLNKLLEDMEGRKFVFTNGTVYHAEKVLDRLGIAHHFQDIFDIVSTGYTPKPNREAYDHVIEATGTNPKRAVMFEDMARNLEVPHAMGMTTVLVQTRGEHPDAGLGVLGTGNEPHVHHVTHDLTDFLNTTNFKRNQKP